MRKHLGCMIMLAVLAPLTFTDSDLESGATAVAEDTYSDAETGLETANSIEEASEASDSDENVLESDSEVNDGGPAGDTE